MKKLILSGVLVLLVLSVPQVSFCAEKKIKNETITLSLGSELENWDPHGPSSAIANSLHRYVFDTLVSRPKGAVSPVVWAAKSYQLRDPKTVDFQMREGIKFTNGEDVDAEAVKYSFTRPLADGFKTVQSAYSKNIDRVEVISKWVVRLHLKGPDPGLFIRLSDLVGKLVPPRYYSSMSQEEASMKPIGSGPYKLVQWKRGVEMVFEANPNYWHPDYPKVQKIRVVPIREEGTKVAALLKGEVGLINNVPPQYIPRIETNPNTEVKSVRGTRIPHIAFTHLIKSPLQDIRVRKAIAHAIQREIIVKSVVEGRGVVCDQPLHEWTEGYDPRYRTPYEYNPEKSKKLLAEAGYPSGFTIDFIGPVGRYLKDKEVCEAVAGMLSKVGIQAKYEPLTWQTFVSRITKAKTNPAETPPFIYYGGYGNGSGDTDACFNALVACKGAWSTYCNPELEKQIDEAATTVDLKKRAQLFQAITREIVSDVSHVFIWQEDSIYGMNKRIRWNVRNDDRVYGWEIDTR